LGVATTQAKITELLKDDRPWTTKDLAQTLKLNRSTTESCLGRMWRSNKILRSTNPIICSEKTFRGRRGTTTNQRQYYTYILQSKNDTVSVTFEDQQYVPYDEKYLDKRGGGNSLNGKSKAKLIKEFLEENNDHAFFSKDLQQHSKTKASNPPTS
jgi:predicted transcriptional regulator